VPPHDVRIWYQATGALDEAAIAAAASVLSDEERAQYHRFRFAHDARDYAAAHALLRATLSCDGDRAPEAWRFDKTANGKPFLLDRDACRTSFSLSHTDGMVACAVTADADVGIDVECVDRDVDVAAVTARFLAPAEAAHLAQLDTAARRDRFFDLWTLKEALVKALGTGLAGSLAALAFTIDANGGVRLDAPEIEMQSWQFALFAPGRRHRLAVATRRSAGPPGQLIFRSIADEP
jgi:4'-phosphopantetheinyl transferase